jgi:uncharacterized protein DUF4189
MHQCLMRGPNCSIAVTYRRKCFAIVFGRSPDRRSGYHWGTRDTLIEAQNAIMSNCRARGGTCELKYSSCDTIDEAMVDAQRREAARQEEARRDAEQRRQREAEESRRREQERQEAERREAVRQESERRAAEARALEKRQWEEQEEQRRQAARREADRKEAERREAERIEWSRREAERQKREREEYERREAENRAADQREQQRREAQRKELDKQEAERRLAQQGTRQIELDRANEPGLVQSLAANYLTVGAGAAAIGLLVGGGIMARRSLPRKTAIAVGIAAPLVSGLIYYAMGLKPYLTLLEWPILLLPYGGGLFLAAIFRWHE